MKTIKTNVFTFSELSKDAKERAIKDNQDINVTDYDWYNYIYENWGEEMFEFGLENVKIYFSGFWSQGDGACFEATIDCDGMKKFMEKNRLKTKYNLVYRAIQNKTEKGLYVDIKIKHSGRYYHEYMTDLIDNSTTQTEEQLTEDTKLGKQWVDLVSFIDDRAYGRQDLRKNCGAGWLIDKNRELYKRLEEEYENLTSEDVVAERLEDNDEAIYTEDGKIY